ncbi:dihydrolipoamide dehydrogenase [Geothermobacter ehrlichii]|uniref:Dihydrolipoyl dehydrogenase n=1 Tax=Geothermobacter ehrlichii TaxID=213224 RepID=A0A5D3WG11_9BACT|nr:dihydrolipoyl dehydrogenase [Geothermobacter ehrlichii]TYO95255.1 dihydrolipoamide dehydrogenase [Geothermobacter ehrlichii]
MKSYDVIILGGGPGGLAAGVALSQMGKSVCLVQESEAMAGGVCLNKGCMPTKALLKAAAVYRQARESQKYGLRIHPEAVNLKEVRQVVDGDLQKLRMAISSILAGIKADVLYGIASFISEHEIEIKKSDGTTETIHGEYIIIATGSSPRRLPFADFDGRYILSSDDMLLNTELPQRLLIVGGGAIGCEFATIYNSFGSEVTLVETESTLLPREEAAVGNRLRQCFEQQGITVKNGLSIGHLEISKGQVHVTYQGSVQKPEIFDKVLVAVGRTPNIEALKLDAAGVATDKGFIGVNTHLQTNVEHIYAVGDINGGLLLAHGASYEGSLAASNIVQGNIHDIDSTQVPRVVFCHPEVACVGVTKELPDVKVVAMEQVPNGRTIVDKVQPAFLKMYYLEDTGILIGASMIGESATEIIHELTLAVKKQLTINDIRQMVYAHPTHAKNVLAVATGSV